MKKAFILYFIIGLVSANAQQIVDNPKTPFNKNPGRILTLKEVMRIPGDGEGYYYSGINKLQIDGSGNIYIRDFWSTDQRANFLVFSPNGQFLRDLYRQGEGPGEIQSAFDFALSESNIFVFDSMKGKIIILENNGKFMKEFKIKAGSSLGLIGIFKDWLIFLRNDLPYERKTSRLYDKKNVIVFVSKDGEQEKDFYTYVNKEFLISPAQGGGMMDWDPFRSVIGNNMLFVCHTQEYLIEALDLETGKVLKRFSRKYPRVKHKLQDWEKMFSSKFNAPKRKFEDDIEALFYDGNYLWVKTSIKDEKKGYLFDLFDSRGQFYDSFFINNSGRIVKIDGDFLYISEKDEDFLPFVVKYKIMDSIGTQQHTIYNRYLYKHEDL